MPEAHAAGGGPATPQKSRVLHLEHRVSPLRHTWRREAYAAPKGQGARERPVTPRTSRVLHLEHRVSPLRHTWRREACAAPKGQGAEGAGRQGAPGNTPDV